jgi:hypothetical protein
VTLSKQIFPIFLKDNEKEAKKIIKEIKVIEATNHQLSKIPDGLLTIVLLRNG